MYLGTVSQTPGAVSDPDPSPAPSPRRSPPPTPSPVRVPPQQQQHIAFTRGFEDEFEDGEIEAYLPVRCLGLL